jgi:hypothetical protein
MKKRLVILTVVTLVLGGAILILTPPAPPPAPVVTVGFLAFTNSGGHAEALFAISNPPNSAVSLHLVRAKEAIGSTPTNTDRGNFSWARREGSAITYSITVDTTNEPLQVVFAFQRPAVGPRRIVEQIRELFGRITGRETVFFTGKVFFVTNATRIDNAPH